MSPLRLWAVVFPDPNDDAAWSAIQRERERRAEFYERRGKAIDAEFAAIVTTLTPEPTP